MWGCGQRWGLIDVATPNPTATIRKYKEQSRERYVRPDEVPRLMTAIRAEGDRGQWWSQSTAVALQLYLMTGLRKLELLRLVWSDASGDSLNRAVEAKPADPPRGSVWLDRAEVMMTSTKSGRTHTVPLVSQAVVLLKSLPHGDSAWVFPGRTKNRPLYDLKAPWGRIRAASGLQDVHLHDLRRTVGAWLAQAGTSMLVLQKTLNHSTYASALVYARLDQDPVRRALEGHVSRLLEADDPGPSE